MKKVIKEMICAVLILLQIPLYASAFSADSGSIAVSCYDGLYRDSKSVYYQTTEYSYVLYDENGEVESVGTSESHKRTKMALKDSSGNKKGILCLECGREFASGQTYQAAVKENCSYFQNLPESVQKGVLLACTVGWHEGATVPVQGCNEDDFRLATQLIVWEYTQQLRTSPTTITANAWGVPADNFVKDISGREAEKCYDWILSAMADYEKLPSFTASTQSRAEVFTLEKNPESGAYTLSLTDENETAEELIFTGNDSVTVTREGNRYFFSCLEPLAETTLTVRKATEETSESFLVWGCGEHQVIASGAEDPVVGYLKLETEQQGKIKIVKTSDDGKVAGIRFFISGTDTDLTVETDADGEIVQELPPGTYTVEELASEEYVTQDPQTVMVVAGETATVCFENTLKKFRVFFTKTGEDSSEKLSGAVYGIYYYGKLVDTYTTGGNGTFTTKEYICGDGWTLREITAPEGYLCSEDEIGIGAQPGNFEAMLTDIHLTESDTRIRGNLILTKVDEEYPENMLSGAVFEVTDEDGKRIGEMTETEEGIYELKDLPYGIYFVQEVKAPEGFRLDESKVQVQITQDGETVVVENEAGIGFINTRQKGTLIIRKTSTDGKVQGFSFLVTGPDEYENTFITDENGEIRIDDLPAGNYTVSEVENDVSSGYVLPEKVTVTVNDLEEVTVSMKNVRPTEDVPNTGDDPYRMLWWLGLLALGIAGMTTILVMKRRKRA